MMATTATKKARRSTLQESNRSKKGVLDWIGWKRDSPVRGLDAPTPVARESVHANVRQSWLEINAAEVGDTNGGVRLVPFAKDVWVAEGPVVDWFGFPYPTRMVVIKLSDGTSWIWSPIELKGEEGESLVKEVEHTAGSVRHLVSPNKIHWLFLKQWQELCPNARTYASPGLEERKIAKNVTFDATLGNTADPAYAHDIDQIIFQANVMDEVEFFHKPSKTAIFCDLIQRHGEEDLIQNSNKFKAWLLKSYGLVGPHGSTPKEWIFCFWMLGLLPKARQTLNVILEEWQPEKLIVAHGENADSGAIQVIDQALSWIPQQPRESVCCFPKSNY